MITQAYLINCISFDFEKGTAVWKSRSDIHKGANSRLSGTDAFTGLNASGYRHGRINQKSYSLHRLIWCAYYGDWPEYEIDHIDGDKKNNSIHNLRIATPSQNRMNRGKQKNNTSGHKGVYLNKRTGKWYAEIRFSGNKKYLGQSDTQYGASCLYMSAIEKYHGQYGRQ